MPTGLWKEPGVPHKGWTCVGVTDLRASDLDAELQTCAMCDVRQIRYVHHMTHPNYAGGLDVGCDCAEKMEADYSAARKREAPLRSRAARRANWVRQGWSQADDGTDWRDSFGYRVIIHAIENGSGWGGAIIHLQSRTATRSTKFHPSADHAKLAAFDTIELWRKRDDQA
jgi:hypothetical protein